MTDYLYDRLPTAGKRLARVPRFGRLIAGIEPSRLEKIRSNAAAYWLLLSYVAANDNDATTGLLDSGLRATGASKLGWRKTSEVKRTHRIRQWQVRLAMQMLGAMAFEMTCGENGDGKTPPVDRVQNRWSSGFFNRVFRRIIASGGYRDSIDQAVAQMVDPDFLDQDWECLKRMNSVGLDYNVFSGTQREILFTDISLRNFFAAHWAVRWATSDELIVTKNWIPDPLASAPKPEYKEFWTFAVELNQIHFDQDDELLIPIKRSNWVRLFSPFYDAQQQPSSAWPIRPTELIYRSWDGMRNTKAQASFLCEYPILLADQDEVAQSILTDCGSGQSQFIHLANPVRPRDKFDTGSLVQKRQGSEPNDCSAGNDNLRHIEVQPFKLHRFCVTNHQFERFAPVRSAQREFESADHDVGKHPVVNVNWYDAWCFAKWLGHFEANGSKYRICLPTDRQWEYACRCGEKTPFTWHSRERGHCITAGDANFNGKAPWPEADSFFASDTDYLRKTIPVDGVDDHLKIRPNPWGIHQMHGNVWEWCDDEYLREGLSESGAFRGSFERVLRGGSWVDYGANLRSGVRGKSSPSNRDRLFGIRLAAVPIDDANQGRPNAS